VGLADALGMRAEHSSAPPRRQQPQDPGVAGARPADVDYSEDTDPALGGGEMAHRFEFDSVHGKQVGEVPDDSELAFDYGDMSEDAPRRSKNLFGDDVNMGKRKGVRV